MIKRYENAKTKRRIIKRGTKSQPYDTTSNTTTVYSGIPKSDNDIYVLTQPGDRLDNIAFKYYGDQNLWWYIAKANHLNVITVEPGLSLRIPATTSYAIGK
jgi:nucleoid-associated protein YgaU